MTLSNKIEALNDAELSMRSKLEVLNYARSIGYPSSLYSLEQATTLAIHKAIAIRAEVKKDEEIERDRTNALMDEVERMLDTAEASDKAKV